MIRLIIELASLARVILGIIKDAKGKHERIEAAKDIKEAFLDGDADRLNDVFNKLRK